MARLGLLKVALVVASASALQGPGRRELGGLESRRRGASSSVVMSGGAGKVEPGSIVVMMNGLPGKMGNSVGEACLARGMELADVALTGAPFAGETVSVRGVSVELVAGGSAEAEAAGERLVRDCAARGKTLIAIDFTVPAAAEANARYYAEHGMSFVMGTTGADGNALSKSVSEGTHSAVIAPNMSKQIVALQAVVERAAKDFPGAFGGYKLETIESHQSSKLDTSGTAKAVVSSLVALADEEVWSKESPKALQAIDDIVRVRDADAQKDGAGGRLGKVPEAALPGHAYHTYSLTSPDETVRFELRHNVDGRSTYAEGVADAAVFLAAQLAKGSTQRLFDMIDVLKAGAMN